jgi:NodT family efflux transporter outer membrane factor (OMF) lipoprotein
MRHSFILLLPVLAGCALHEASPKPPVMPAAFEARPAAGEVWPGQDWYKEFGSGQLQTLIEQAANNNLDLAMARARVIQADARARQAGAAILPAVDAGANGNYLAGHSANGSAHETDWAVLLSASYEIDFWGKNRALAHSATLQAEASRADRDTLALTTLAAVADGYFHVLSLRERLNIAAANVDAAQRLLDVIQARFNEGLANPVELSAQKATLATAALVVPDLKQQEAEALASLALLLGRAPEQFSVAGESLEAMVEPKLGAGIPAELLTRRPDVFMAEANMQAANANLLAARAALLPSFNLTLSGGLQNPALNAAVITLSGVGPTVNLGASVVQTIFDGGRLRAMRAEAQAKDEELVAAYRSTILAALVDVENALSGMNHLEEAKSFQLESVTQSERAFEGATLRYKAGSGDFLTVLEAQRSLYAARDQYSQYKLARLEASVALCKALGGGWQTQSATLSTRDAR